jgi:hypothetical protein
MRIGIDLDQCVFGFPEFFELMINCMLENPNVSFHVTSNHFPDRVESDKQKLTEIGIDPNRLDWSLMPQEQTENFDGVQHKKQMADSCDICFDDFVKLNQFTETPVFVAPNGKAQDKRAVT